MAHHTIKSSYARLVDRLNRFPQGAPPSDLLYKILAMLFSQKEAEWVAMLPIKPFTADKARRIWRMNPTETRKVLDELAGRAILVDIEQNGESVYVLPPPMAALLGAILKLPPLKQVLANQQVKSRYLEALINYNEKRTDLN
jgi:hypothetical protein